MKIEEIKRGMKVTRPLCRVLKIRSSPEEVEVVEPPHDVYVMVDGERFRRHPHDLEPA